MAKRRNDEDRRPDEADGGGPAHLVLTVRR
jgi:hypothetical protein